MTIDTETIRNASAILDTLTSNLAADHPLRLDAQQGAKASVADLYGIADEADAQGAEIERLRGALRWTAAVLNSVCGSAYPVNDHDTFGLDGKNLTTGEILDAADAALGRAALSGDDHE